MKQRTIWECSSCGFTQNKWGGLCTKCNNWNSFVEQVVEKHKTVAGSSEVKALNLSQLEPNKNRRISTLVKGVDSTFGGGVVAGSLSLIGGEPGIGKSTLMLQVANGFALQNIKVLYVCGEESIEQTSIRAKRLNVENNNIFFLHETKFENIIFVIDDIKPEIVIIDSIQILYKESIPSSAGSVVQVREITYSFLQIAKKSNIAIFLIGHVTKSGDLAGPRVLEHLVDGVFEFEREGQGFCCFRILRAFKNRFGSTEEIAIFQMKENGLIEIENPASLFLENSNRKMLSGSTIVPILNGSRVILMEVQALVTQSVFSTPSRKSTGIDSNRLSLLLAVLEKRLKFSLYNSDIFASVVGGIKILEPAADLAIITSIISSFKNKPISHDIMVLGEVGLGGEVRAITKIENRIKEGANLGFKSVILPKRNLNKPEIKDFGISLIGVDIVEDLVECLF